MDSIYRIHNSKPLTAANADVINRWHLGLSLLLSLLATNRRITMKIKEMEERAKRLHEHVLNHPADYQSVIAELKLHSEIIDRRNKDIANARLREVARIRRRRNAKQGQ